MQTTDLPTRFPIPFANGAGGSYIRPIPTAHVAASGSDAPASLYDGFPPETFTPVSSGGVPPNGKDFNGLFNQITAWARWQAAGAPSYYDAAFSTAINGYPKGSRLTSTADASILWVSTADNNTTNPDGGSPTNWAKFGTITGNFVIPKGHFDMEVAPGVTLRLNWGKTDVAGGSASTDTFDAAYTLLFGVWHGGGTANPADGYKTAAYPGTSPNTTTTVNLTNGTAALLTIHWIALGLA